MPSHKIKIFAICLRFGGKVLDTRVKYVIEVKTHWAFCTEGRSPMSRGNLDGVLMRWMAVMVYA